MQATGEPAGFDAIVLAGGRAARLGGADKPALRVGGSSLLGAVVSAAAAAGAGRCIIVGPPRPGVTPAGQPGPGQPGPGQPGPGQPGAEQPGEPGGESWPRAFPSGRLLVVQEQPPQSGPVPAIRRGLAEVQAPWIAVLAGDLPFLTGDQLRALLQAAPGAGCVLADDGGRPQWLAGVWRMFELRQACGQYRGSSVRGLLGPLAPALLRPQLPPGEPPPWLDCDSPADLAAARAWAGPGREGPS